MTDIQSPIGNERAADTRLGVGAAQLPDSVPVVAQRQPRIVYRYWAGAIVLGILLWVAIFLIL